MVFRGIQRRDLRPDEAVLNGLEALKAAAIGELSEPRRAAALTLLDRTGADDAFAHQVRMLLADETNLPNPNPNRFERGGRAVRAWYLGLAQHRWFGYLVTCWFAFYSVAAVVAAVLLGLDHGDIKGFEEWAVTVSSVVAGLLMLVGLVRIRHGRLAAYRWFERGVLVQIFVTQVFEFAQEQLAGVLGLVFNLLLWISLRSMIRAEIERQLVEPELAEPKPVAS
jgi:hypothetical protein